MPTRHAKTSAIDYQPFERGGFLQVYDYSTKLFVYEQGNLALDPARRVGAGLAAGGSAAYFPGRANAI